MKMKKVIAIFTTASENIHNFQVNFSISISERINKLSKSRVLKALSDQRGDVPGWVLVVLMTTGLVTAIWTIAAPRLTAILKNSLDAMNGIR